MITWVKMSFFVVNMSSSLHINNIGKDILILGKVPIQGLDYTTLTIETKYSINFSRSHRNFCLSLHYNGNNSVFVNATKIYQSYTKNSEITPYPLCLGNTSKDFSVKSMKKKTVLNGCVYNFFVDYRAFDIIDITNILKYLMKT